MSAPRLTPADRDAIARDYQAGRPIAAIAREHGVDPAYPSIIARRRGLAQRFPPREAVQSSEGVDIMQIDTKAMVERAAAQGAAHRARMAAVAPTTRRLATPGPVTTREEAVRRMADAMREGAAANGSVDEAYLLTRGYSAKAIASLGYWWDIEGESPVDPVEIYPHPLTRMSEAEEPIHCDICAGTIRIGDICATDIELGMVHAVCIDGSPTVNLETGEQVDGPIPTYRYEGDR